MEYKFPCLNIKIMLRFFILNIFILLGICAYSQEQGFILQPDLTTKTIDGHDYLIVSRDSLSAEDLYNQTLSAIMSLQKYSNESIICKENESIILEGFSPEALIFKDMIVTQYYGLHYWLKFDFKDNKIRVSAPKIKAFQMGAHKVEGGLHIVKNHKIFVKGKPGKGKQATKARETITSLLNKAVFDIIEYKNEGDW